MCDLDVTVLRVAVTPHTLFKTQFSELDTYGIGDAATCLERIDNIFQNKDQCLEYKNVNTQCE